MICICLICLKPTKEWLQFLSRFRTYHIYIVIDDNSIHYKTEYSRLHFIQIQERDCRGAGFTDMNFVIHKEVSGWEKAVYYFSTINRGYERVWFIEDDVFFYDEDTLLQIDAKFAASDLLTNSYTENLTGSKDTWHWSKIQIELSPPYYSAMVCATRMSRALLSKIGDYAFENKSLFFLEALFPTLCKRHQLQYDTPDELRTIRYRYDYTIRDIDTRSLYHPVKDMGRHRYFRWATGFADGLYEYLYYVAKKFWGYKFETRPPVFSTTQ